MTIRGHPRTIAWRQIRGDLTAKLDGAYTFDDAGEGRTQVTYVLEVELRVPLPGFHKAAGAEPDHAHSPRGSARQGRVLANHLTCSRRAGSCTRPRRSRRA